MKSRQLLVWKKERTERGTEREQDVLDDFGDGALGLNEVPDLGRDDLDELDTGVWDQR